VARILLRELACESPILLVCLIGLVLAVVLRRQDVARRILVALGTGLIILAKVVFAILGASSLWDPWQIRMSVENGLWPQFRTPGLIDIARDIGGNTSIAVALALLIAAAFYRPAVGARAPSQGRLGEKRGRSSFRRFV
jgi:hypothetical protein